MGNRNRIPLQLNPSHDIEIDGARVAGGFDIGIAEFRQLMDDSKISVLCERGTGEDAGLYRASFYLGDRRVRLVVDGNGDPVAGPDN